MRWAEKKDAEAEKEIALKKAPTDQKRPSSWGCWLIWKRASPAPEHQFAIDYDIFQYHSKGTQ